MSEKMICKYCFVDLSSADTFSMSGNESNRHYFCKDCIPMMRLVSNCVKDAINERVFFALACISENITRSERLNGKTSETQPTRKATAGMEGAKV